MILLQALHFKFAFFQGAQGVEGGLGRGQGGGVGDVVLQGHPADGVGVRRGVAAPGVLITRAISRFLMRSMMWGRPSRTLWTSSTAPMPCLSRQVAVPRVA